MNEKEIRIAIAEACGYVYVAPTTNVNEFAARICWENGLPDYPNDLNACHEMEKTLNPVQWNLYTSVLEHVTRKPESAIFKDGTWMDINPSRLIDALLVHATARQRCEAFLKTIGKWKDALP